MTKILLSDSLSGRFLNQSDRSNFSQLIVLVLCKLWSYFIELPNAFNQHLRVDIIPDTHSELMPSHVIGRDVQWNLNVLTRNKFITNHSIGVKATCKYKNLFGI